MFCYEIGKDVIPSTVSIIVKEIEQSVINTEADVSLKRHLKKFENKRITDELKSQVLNELESWLIKYNQHGRMFLTEEV